ncbi:MAG TPA: hypothetical protein VET66_04520 [Steroidobacteraceae bacterium]|nr:hypothetical protein [Steroidobacteraceae bacterium]
MTLDYRVALLAAGVLLLLAALVGGRVLGTRVSAAVRTGLRLGVAVLGVALLAWTLTSYRGAPAAPVAAAATHPPMPVDLVRLASADVAACALPGAPSLPDGDSASLQQMTAARQAFETYDAATAAYTQCVDAAIERVAKQQASAASAADMNSLRAFGMTAHNTAIAQEQAVADHFNGQIRAYKAKHPK